MQSRISENLKPENRILFDWVTFTSRIHSVHDIIELLGFTDCHFVECAGINGYRDGLAFDGVKICWNNWSCDDSICVSMSGKGCRSFEEFGNGDYYSLFSLILSEYDDNPEHRSMNLTRLDVAYDDFNGLISFDSCISDLYAHNWVSRFHRGKIEHEIGNDSSGLAVDLFGKSIYFGSKSSDVRIRIYDKRAEQVRVDIDYWYRCELQLRRSNALGFASEFCSEGSDIGRLYYGVINNYLRFVVPTGDDTNKRRWNIAEHWLKFLSSLDVIHIFVKIGQSYDISKLDNYVLNTAANAIYTLINVIGVDHFIQRLRGHYISCDLNPKYKIISDSFPEHENGILSYMSLHNLSAVL